MKYKTPLIALAVVITLALIVWAVVLPGLINKDNIKSEIAAAFEQATGMKLEIQGDAVFKMLPMPHIIVDSAYVVNAPGTKSPFLLKIRYIDIWPVFSTLFEKQIAVRKLQVKNVDIELETLTSGQINWLELSHLAGQGVNATPVKPVSSILSNASYEVLDAHIHYSDAIYGTSTTIEVPEAVYNDNAGGGAALKAQLDYLEHHFTITGQMGGSINAFFSPEGLSADFDVVSGASELHYKGTAGYKNTNPVLNGDLQITADDFTDWLEWYRGEANHVTQTNYTKLPVTLRTKITTDAAGTTTFSDLVVGGDVIKGAGWVQVSPKQVAIKAALTHMNLESIMDNGVLLNIKSKNASIKNVVVDKTPPRDIEWNARIDDISYNRQNITNASFTADLNGSELTIPEFTATLPGKAQLVFAGIGRANGNGLTLEGQVDAQGNNLIETLALFKFKGLSLPHQDFKRFHIRTNTLISTREVRFSELAARIENMGIQGGFGLKFDGRPNLQAALGISGLNMDNLIELWGVEDWEKAFLSNDHLKNNQGVVSLWLKNLDYDFSVNTLFDNYILQAKTYDRANLNIVATKNHMQVSGAHIPYNGSLIDTKAEVDVSREIPKLTLQASLDKMDANAFFNIAPRKNITSGEKWSSDVLDFNWLALMNAGFDLKVGHLKYNDLEADNVVLSGFISDQKLSIETMRAKWLDANVSGTTQIMGGAIPTLAAVANITDLKLENAAPHISFLHPLSGLCNVNLRLSTNGTSMVSWASNLDGSLAIAGRDIGVRGFNLPGIIRAVSYVRTVADILNVVKRAFPNGNATFASLEGSWNITKGIMDATHVKVSNAEAEGVFASKSDLVKWATNTTINFSLKALDPVNPPKMIITITGNLDNPGIDVDTRSLEQYVNNKTSERILH